MMGERLTQYEVIIIENSVVSLWSCFVLIPAIFLSAYQQMEHEYEQIITHNYVSCPDLGNQT